MSEMTLTPSIPLLTLEAYEKQSADQIPLTLMDRCDACNAQAFVRASFEASDLLFCRHHGQKMLITLAEKAKSIYVMPVPKD